MKKLIIALTVILSILSLVGNVFAAEETIPTFNCYLADFTINNSIISKYDFYKNEYYGIYRSYVDNGKKNPAFQAGLVTWEIGTFQLSDIAEENNKRVGFYETILYDVMYQGHMNEPISDTYKEIVSSVKAKSLKKLSDYMEMDSLTLLKSKTANLSAEKQVKLAQTLQGASELSSVFDVIGKIDTVIGYVNTVEELIDKLAKTEAIIDRVKENKATLQNMKQNTTNSAFISAIDNMMLICDEHLTLEQVKNYFKAETTARELSEFMLKSVWNTVIKNLNGYGLAISAGQAGGKLMSNTLFSTDENLELYYSLNALAEYEDAMKAALDIAEKNYKNNPTEDNAVAFNEAYKLLVQTHILGVEAAKKVVVFENESGLVQSIITRLTKNDYGKAIADLDIVKESMTKTLSTLYGNVYNLYIIQYGAEAEALGLLPKTLPTTEENNNAYTFLSNFSSEAQGVVFSKDYTLTEDRTIYADVSVTGGTLNLNGFNLKVVGNLTVNGNVNLNTGTLTVNGDLFISGTINIEQGSLDVLGNIEQSSRNSGIYVEKGNLTVCNNYSSKAGTFDAGSGKIVVNGSFSINTNVSGNTYERSYFRMNNEDSHLIINGDFNFNTSTFSENKINAGKLEVFGNLNLTGGYLYFQGGAIYVYGDFMQKGTINLSSGNMEIHGSLLQDSYSNINLSGGLLEIHGDFKYDDGTTKLTGGMMEVYGDFDRHPTGRNPYFYLLMQNDDAYLLIHGNFTIQTYHNWNHESNYTRLTAGTMELKGDFKQANESYNFQPSGTHKVILSGTQNQTVYFEDPDYSRFNILEFQNDNVEFLSYVKINELANDVINTTLKVINTNFNYKPITINSDLYCSGTVDINSFDLNVLGDINQTSGTINIRSGKLNVYGDFMQEGTINLSSGNMEVQGSLLQNYTSNINISGGTLKIHGDFKYDDGTTKLTGGIMEVCGNFNKRSDSYNPTFYLLMQNDEAYLLIHGDFTIETYHNWNHESNYTRLTAGTMELKGNFRQANENYNFQPSGTHKVVLSGTEKQTVYFEDPNYSRFNILVNKNPDAIFNSTNYKYLFWEIPHTITVKSSNNAGEIFVFADSTKETRVLDELEKLEKKDGKGYVFEGWYTDENFTTPLENILIQSDMTVYAKYVKQLMKFENVEYLSGNNTLSVTTSIDEELQDKNGIVIIAVYSENGLIEAYYADATSEVSHNFNNLPVIETEYIVKAFCWSDLKNIIPLCESISTTVQ